MHYEKKAQFCFFKKCGYSSRVNNVDQPDCKYDQWKSKKILKKKTKNKKKQTANKMVGNKQAKNLTLWNSLVFTSLIGNTQDENPKMNPRKGSQHSINLQV